MHITWDLVGRVLITAPFVLICAGTSGVCLVGVVVERRWYKRLGFLLAALVMASFAAGILILITLSDNGTWCFKAPKGDPACTVAPE